ncbi:MAG: T9SS type A sorting domain-containing protein [Bacteroidales bacterium]|nr:T9SS type A sorting domain-containing protein [Bacteroidales bacterium]
MINLNKILLIAIVLVFGFQITNAQTISVCRTVATSNQTKNNGYSCSYVVASSGLCSYYKVNINNDNNFIDNNFDNTDNVEVSLYPNPFTDVVNIKYPKIEKEQTPKVCFIDSNGKLISTSFVFSDYGNYATLEISTNSLSSGIYTIRIISDNKLYIVNAVKI